MKFMLEINLGETVTDGTAIASILKDNVYTRLMSAGVPGDQDAILDAEGNKVGAWMFAEA